MCIFFISTRSEYGILGFCHEDGIFALAVGRRYNERKNRERIMQSNQSFAE